MEQGKEYNFEIVAKHNEPQAVSKKLLFNPQASRTSRRSQLLQTAGLMELSSWIFYAL